SVHWSRFAASGKEKTRAQAGQSGRSRRPVTLAHLGRTSGPLTGSRRRSRAAKLAFVSLGGRHFLRLLRLCSSILRRRGPRPRHGSGAGGGTGIHGEAGAHRRARGDRNDLTALGGGGLGANDLLDPRRVVLEQVGLGEARLADRQVDDRLPVRAVLDLPGL